MFIVLLVLEYFIIINIVNNYYIFSCTLFLQTQKNIFIESE